MIRPCVYLLASERNGTLYVGVTGDVVRRVWEHRNGVADGFTKRYGVRRLVHAEADDAGLCLTKQVLSSKQRWNRLGLNWRRYFVAHIIERIKKWRRAWKIRLIEENNPEWRDMYSEISR